MTSPNDKSGFLPADDSAESKTRRKQRMTAMQKLGEELLTLNARQLQQIELPESLQQALKEYQRLPNKNEAKRRQLQFIGKVMRAADHEAIAAALQKLRTPSAREVRRSQDIERWGQRLLSTDDDALEAFLEKWPTAERQTLRQLQRNYGSLSDTASDHISSDEQIMRARRKLLDYIKSVID
jgi:ribosome-associated protein